MRQLIDIARDRGIKRMLSRDIAENARMKSFARFLGFDAKQDPQDPHMVVHTLALD
jgi:acetyltransferase